METCKTSVRRENILYKDYLYHWLKRKEKLVKASTHANYSLKVANHLIPVLGNEPLRAIDSRLVQQAVFTWLEEGSRLGGGLRLKSIKDLVAVISSTLKTAAKEGLRRQETLDIDYPRPVTIGSRQVLTLGEQKRLTEYLRKKPTPHNLGLLIALQTGMRIGEICGLQWQDIDFKQRVIHVHKTLGRIFGRDREGRPYNKVVISTPKTAHSVRTIPLSKTLEEVLWNQRAAAVSYVLTGRERFTEPSNYRTYFYKLQKKLKLTQLNFHGLRHTFATRLIEKGVDYKTVSELLGHASVNTTLNLYVHPNLQQKRKAVDKLNL